ncbi:hypothetical protein PtA15_3A283 [Puccinia triticina]|uniref:Uncharacterized protein n=1 Tax=Puccinia triticina TaxID=208348 RepID=A0ABY7CEW7_9BASI|nr:uncharacterized protein PtA15_3A283 [Puccinia triticina]WAQ82918.1 hypothetical protein PtA15_3A283 [Puccinia triticina]
MAANPTATRNRRPTASSNMPIPLNPLPPSTSDHHHELPLLHCSSSSPYEAFLPVSPDPYANQHYHSEGSNLSDSLHSANSLCAHSRNHSVQQSQDSHSHSSSFKSFENTPTLPSAPTPSSSSKLVKSNGRPKVNTLPPWAKGHDDDDLLFQPLPIPPTPALKSPNPSRSELDFQPQRTQPQPHQPEYHQQQDQQHQSDDSKNATISKFPRYSVSNSTLVPDSPFTEHEWTITQDQVNNLRHNLQSSSTEPVHKLGSQQYRPPSTPSSSNPQANPGPSTTRRSLYRAMTTPSPVFQRFRPLITINGQRKRATEDSFNQAGEEDPDLEQGSETPTGRPRLSPHQPPPDDRWWQFTLPTKYRRKVEEYLSRGGQGIGGVGHLVDDRRIDNIDHSALATPRLEMVEIDEDRRKILALLKRHASPHSTRYSSLDSNDPHFDLQRYGSLPGLSPLYKPTTTDDEVLDLGHTHHPPTDFPLSAFSRKMSLTPSQQQQIFEGVSVHHKPRSTHHPFDESMDNLHAKKPYSSSLHTATNHDPRSRTARIGSFFMHHPTAPLLCRLINLLLTAIALGLCATIRKTELQLGASGVLGASTMFVLVAAPMGLLHNLFAIYCEYFGAPIGIWSVSWKMFHTLSELVFVSLWSAGLALTMNDELRSPLGCQRAPSAVAGMPRVPAELAGRLATIKAAHPTLSQDVLNTIVRTTLDHLSPPVPFISDPRQVSRKY